MIFLKEINYKGRWGVALAVKIQPNASKNQIVGKYRDRLKVKIQSDSHFTWRDFSRENSLSRGYQRSSSTKPTAKVLPELDRSLRSDLNLS